MEKGERFSEYLFAKMGPGDRGPKTTEDRSAPVERTGVRKFLADNVMLVVTLVGVLTGIAIGKYFNKFLFNRCTVECNFLFMSLIMKSLLSD